MAEAFIRDLSEYLLSGNLSDLTLAFGEKSWQIHKALACCHSTWFRNAITNGFQESQSNVITLKDDPEFADAIDCMISYFYKAHYDVSQYDISEALLHAKVATIADKYDCMSLYKLAKYSFSRTIDDVEIDGWVAVAAVIYDYTTTDSPAHKELRNLVVSAVVTRPGLLESIIQLESTSGLLRSTADLATDLLLSGLCKPEKQVAEPIFICGNCRYLHVGSRDCAKLMFQNSAEDGMVCPCCRTRTGSTTKKRHVYRVGLVNSFSCPSCDGFHTTNPETTLDPW